MDYKNRVKAWLDSKIIDENYKNEVRNIKDEDELKDRFYQDLEFGTAGLRGIVGAGTNRMNEYVIARASMALGKVCIKHSNNPSVVIARDVRNKSYEFSIIAARALANLGVKVYLFDDIRPTPMLSYAVRYLNTTSGIVITASHNPTEYNGYKVYWSEGSQILEDKANEILAEINNLSFEDIKLLDYDLAKEKGLIEIVSNNLDESYYRDTLSKAINNNLDYDINVVYTPLNGTGNKPVRHVLKTRGFKNINVVKEQENPDPYFKTVGYPNPEDVKAFKIAKEYGKKLNADLIIATDPDCDRVAMLGKYKDDYYAFNGNQIGALLIYYILSSLNKLGNIPDNGAIVKSIVTGNLGKDIAKSFGVECINTLTGFKNICSMPNKWDKTKEYKFIFGYEESIGYVYGDHVRDKDGVVSSMMIVEMAAFYKNLGKSLVDVLNEIYEKYGYYKEELKSLVYEGIDGKDKISKMMRYFRNNEILDFGGIKLSKKEDYLNGIGDIPAQNLIIYTLEDDSWFALRPSGTEPKIKLYIYVKDINENIAENKLNNIRDNILNILEGVE